MVPASSYFESDLCQAVFKDLNDLTHLGIVRLVGGGQSFEEFRDEKLGQYSAEEAQGRIYRLPDLELDLPWRTRQRSSTRDLIQEWNSQDFDKLGRYLTRDNEQPLRVDFLSRAPNLEEILEGRAFVVPNVSKVLWESPPSILSRNRLHARINRGYFGSYTAEFGASIVKNLQYLDIGLENISADPINDLDYSLVLNEVRREDLLRYIAKENGVGLLSLRNDNRWRLIVDNIKRPGREMKQSQAARLFYGRGYSPEDREIAENAPDNPRVLVITALPKELGAMDAAITSSIGEHIAKRSGGRQGDPAIYRWSTVQVDGKQRYVLLTVLTEMNITNAAVATINALRSYPSIEHVLMVGIAGGCPNIDEPENHVRLGDIVVSDVSGVIQFDYGKRLKADFEMRGRPYSPSQKLLQCVQFLRTEEQNGQKPWRKYIDEIALRYPKTKRPVESEDRLTINGVAVAHPTRGEELKDYPVVHHGGIGSSNAVLKDEELRDKLRKERKIKAIEMEGVGVAAATNNLHKGFLVIRGICDYCNLDKGDTWQIYAAVVAAAYARCIIEVMPPDWFET